ncbi:MAG: TonB C-terminal domain-containing protein [Myxococcales bacterium]|nr:MAG: TonB C-terminal domain-containing protein [Myxococcales bacterium]
MLLKKALIVSVIIHAIGLGFLGAGVNFSWFLHKKNQAPLEAKVIFKGKARDKELLPKKKTVQPAQKVAPAKVVQKKTTAKTPVPPKKTEIAQKKIKNLAKPVVKQAERVIEHKAEYAEALKKLSASFNEDLSQLKDDVAPEDFVVDSDYFDQIYTLIKEAFIVPPHVNGPQGQKLQAIIRLYLQRDGSLFKLNLERSSGDEHFDKAVLDGAKRVNNFGEVPILLQNALSENGVVIELCPFKCVK